ncbi:MAG TPA: invasin domain 3-containing protein [Gemmatimonadaceae bacterium]|nr:invasin domain 3-containing protein [Gemmatimonadaceae bacterium]
MRSYRSFARYAGGVAVLAFVAATCRDLTGPTGVATEGGPITVVYRGPTDTNGVVQLTVGDKISPPVEIRIRGTLVNRARYVFSNMDTSVLKVSKNGDSLYAVARGRDTVVVALVGSTIGGSIEPGSVLKDTVLVAVKPARNLVTTNPIPTLRSFGDTAVVSAESRDINNVRTKAGKVRWYSADPAIFTVDSVGTANPDGTNTSVVRAVRNGTVDLITIFDDVETVRTPVNVQQLAATYLLRSRFGGGAPGAPVDFRSLGDTATLIATPADARGNPLAAGSLPAPTPTFSVNPPGKVSVNAVSGLLTANFNTDLGAPVTAVATGVSGTTTVTSDPLPIVVQQIATTISIIGRRVDTIPSIGSTKDLIAIVKDARGNDVQTGITWTSRNTAVAQFRTTPTGDVALAIDTGTTRFVVSRDLVADSITVIVTNDPETIELKPDTVFIRSLDEVKRFTSITVRNFKGDPLPNIPITWTSADPAIVQANADSTIVGKAVGATNVTAHTANGKTTTSRVVVTNAPAILDILPASSTLASVGDTLLNIAVDFRNGLGVALPRSAASWSSNDVNVATVNVDPSGNVRIIAAGTGNTYIRAASPVDPLVRDSVFVTVTNAPASIVAAPNPAPTLTALGSNVTFTATVFNASGNPIPTAKLRWSVLAGTAVSIDSVTGVATALQNGPATIRATSGMITADIPLTVAQAIAGTRSTISAGAASLTADGASSTSITVQLKDANDNPIAFGGSTVVLSTSLGALGSTTPTDIGNGQYTTTLTAGTVTGSASVTGNVNGNAITNSAVVAFTASAASKYIVTPTNLTPVAGTSVTVRAQLADANNNPIPTAGSVVQFASTNGGSFAPANGQATTDGAGVATITFLTNTTTSSHTVSATTGGIAGLSAAIVTVAGAATKYIVTPSTTSPVASSVVTVSAQLADANNNIVAQQGQTASWSHTGTGSFPGGATDNSTTNTSGVATISFTTAASSGQTATVTATTGGVTGTSAAFTTISGTATQLAVILAPSANPQSGVAFPTQPTIQLRDAQGNAVNALNVSVTATITSGGGTLGGTTTVQTDASGLATFTDLSITGFIGARTLTFSASGLSSTTAGVTLVAGNAAQLTVTTAPSTTPRSGIAFQTQPAIQLRDAQGNLVTTGGVIVTAGITSGGGSLTGGLTATTVAGTGLATFTGLTITGTVGARTISFSSPGLTAATANVTLAAGNAAQLGIATQPAGAIAGSPFATQPVIEVRDAQGNVVLTDASTVSAALGAGTGTLQGTLNASAVNGVATFTNLRHNTAETITIQFTDGALTPATSANLVVSTGVPAQLSVAQAPTATPQSGIPFPTQPTIQLRDAQGNAVSQANVNVTATITAGAGTLGGTTTVQTDGTGLATFTNLEISGVTGARTLTFSASGLSNTTAGVTLAAGNAAQLTVATTPSTSPQNAIPFTTQPALQLRDAAGNIVTTGGIVVTAAITSGGGVLSGPVGGVTATTAAGTGIATFQDLTITGIIGAQTITFTAPSLTGVASNVTLVAGALNHFLVEAAGGGAIQQQTAGSSFNIRVVAQDVSDNVVTSFSGGANTVDISSPNSATFSSGNGTTPAFTNGVLASRSVTITNGGTFSLSATKTAGAETGTSNLFTVLLATQYIVTAAPTVQSGNTIIVSAQLADAGGTPVATSGKTISWSKTGPGGTFATPTSLTDANGVAQIAFTGTVAGVHTVIATDNTSLTGTSGAITVTPGSLAGFLVEANGGGSIATQSAGVPFLMQITARDASNNTVTSFSGAGNTVTLTSTSAISAGGGVTGTFTNGVLTGHSITLTTAGAGQTITATRTSGGAQSGSSAGFSINPAALDNFLVTAVSGGAIATQTAGAAFNVRVTARDQFSNTVTSYNGPGNRVNFSSTSAINSGAGPSATFSNGVLASHTITLTTAGAAHTITATRATGGAQAGTSASFAIDPGAATKLVLVQEPSATATAGVIFAQQPIVEIQDAFDNLVTSDNSTVVTATAAGGTGPLIGLSVRTAVNGVVAYGGLRYDQAETITLDFTSSPVLTGDTSDPVDVSANALHHFAISAITTPQVAGTPFTFTITAQDAFDNTVTSFDGAGNTVDISGEPGTVVLGEPVTSGVFTNGVLAGQAVTVTSAGLARAVQVVRSGGTETALSNDFDVVAGAAHHLSFVDGPTQTQAGATITPAVTVEVRDQFDNVVEADNTTDVMVAIGTNPSGGTLAGTLTRQVVAGVATFANLSINLVGSGYTLTATSNPALALATSNTFNIIP